MFLGRGELHFEDQSAVWRSALLLFPAERHDRDAGHRSEKRLRRVGIRDIFAGHPKNNWLYKVGPKGNIRQSIEVGSKMLCRIGIHPDDGSFCVTHRLRGVERFSAAGETQREWLCEAVTAHHNARGRGIWVVTTLETFFRGSDGPIRRYPHVNFTLQGQIATVE